MKLNDVSYEETKKQLKIIDKQRKKYYEYINKKLDYLLDKVPRDKNKELKEKKEYLSYYL